MLPLLRLTRYLLPTLVTSLLLFTLTAQAQSTGSMSSSGSSASDTAAQTRNPEGSIISPMAKAQSGGPSAEALPVARAWTREEMLSARSLDMNRYDRYENSQYEMMAGPTGPVGGTSGGQPAGAALMSAATGASVAEAPSAALLAVQGFNYPYPFDRYAALSTATSNEYRTYPYITVGKVFFKQGGQSFVCSASSIGNYAVITAGHCVHQGNNLASGWSTNWVFVPGYLNGAAPYGQFTYKFLRVMSGWYTSHNFAYDVGGAVLNKNLLPGQITPLKVSQRVGWLGTIWNLAVTQHFHSLGYPQAAPFNGQSLQICSASYGANDGTLNFGIGCDMTPGSSGGPWVYKWRNSTGNRVNGVNSYKYTTTRPLAMFTPVFNTAVGNMINCLINSSPTITNRCAPPAAP